MFDAASSSRRLLLLCIVTTVVPAICLSWLAWQVVREDRQRNPSPVRDRRERAVAMGMNSLQRLLAHAEERLGAQVPEGPGPLVDGLSFVVLRRPGGSSRGGTSYVGAKPLYFPTDTPNPFGRIRRLDVRDMDHVEDQVELLHSADEKEFRQRDLPGALAIVRAVAGDRHFLPRTHALMRLARLERKLGHLEEALDAYARLGKPGDIPIGRLPSALVAAKGRALIFAETGRRADLQREAADIHHRLVNGYWDLSRGDFLHAYNQSVTWLGGNQPPLDVERVAVAEALNLLWGEASENWMSAGLEHRSRPIRVGNVSLVTLSQWSPGMVKAAVMTPRYLERAWRTVLRSAPVNDGIDFVLVDDKDRAVVGALSGPPARRSFQSGESLQLPWKVYAITAEDDSVLGTSTQTNVVLSGIALIALLAVAGAYMINRAMLRELRAAQMQSDFVAAVSHEFRTPLTTLRQLAEMLVRNRVSSDERRRQFYDTLLRESERLQRLVEGLLNFGAMQAGELRYRFETAQMEPLVRDVVIDFERSIEGRRHEIQVQVNESSLPVRADRELLARVFWNLLDNAVKYSPDNPTIRVELGRVTHRVAVSVRDGGVGIADAEQQTIFRKFARGAAAKTVGVQGTGVGLAMALQIIEAHGGEITVTSKPGQGSVFTVFLPMARP